MTDPIAERIRRVRALCDSPNAGEAKAARRKMVELRRQYPEHFAPSSRERQHQAHIHAGAMVIGAVEQAIRDRVAAVRQEIAPALATLDGLEPDDGGATAFWTKVLRLTWADLCLRLVAIQRHRDWQFSVWGATTRHSLTSCERDASPLVLWIELVEDALAFAGRAAALREAL